MISFQDAYRMLLESYFLLVRHIVPGPQSLTYLVASSLTPVALMIPPSILSHKQLGSLFLPIIYGCVVHAWYKMNGTDVISFGVLLWSTFLLAFKDPRQHFQLLHRVYDTPRIAPRLSPLHKNCNNELAPGGSNLANVTENSSFPSELQKTSLSSSVRHSGIPVQYHPRKSSNSILSTAWEEPYPATLARRLPWVITLCVSIRLHGWRTSSPSEQIEQSNLPEPRSRLQFVFNLLLHLFSTLLLLAVVTQLSYHDLYFTTADIAIGSRYRSSTPSHSIPFTIRLLHHLSPYILRPLTLGLYAFSLVRLQYLIPAPIAVISNYLIGLPPDSWSPHTISRYFGHFSSVLDHGIAGLWGKWWHQTVRIMDSTPGVWLADVLGLGKRNSVRYALQVASAFCFSGLTHMGLVPSAPAWSGVEPNRLRLQIAAFFWVQGVGIMVEVGFGKLWASLVKRSDEDEPETDKVSRGIVSRALRLLWVLVWICLTVPLLAETFRELGWWYMWPPPFLTSSMQCVLSGKWLP